MSEKNQLPVSIRNLRARLRLLKRPMVWGSVVLLGLFSLFSWELWSNPEQFFTEEFNPDADQSPGLEKNSLQSSEAIAADIDTSLVLEEDMKGLETPLPILPTTDFKPLKPKKTESSEVSTLTTPPAVLPNLNAQNPQGLGNIFLSGNAAQTQIDDVLSPHVPGNPLNNMNGSGINLWWGNGDINSSSITPNSHNISPGNNSGSTMSPLQEAIIRRSVTPNLPNSTGVTTTQTTTAQTTTTAQSNSNLPGSVSTSPTSQINSDNIDRQPAVVSAQGNHLLLDAQTNPLNLPGATGTNLNPDQTSGISRVTDPVIANHAELLIPLSPASSRGANAAQRSYNPYNQSVQDNNSTNPNNSYQYLLNSRGSNSVTGATNPEQFINPRSAPSLRTPTAPRTYPQPSVTIPNRSNLETSTPENLGAIGQPSIPTYTQPSVSPLTQPSVQTTPSLRSVDIPQGVQTTVPNANGFNGAAVNSNLSRSPGQTLQPAPAFTVPRPIPGRYIGGGQINTFSNP